MKNGLKITRMLKSQQDKLVQVLVSKNSLQEISTSLMLLDQLKMKRSKNYKIRISNTKNLKLRKIWIVNVLELNKENDFVDELDKQQLKAIYSGKAKTWKDVNSKWPDKKINAVSPNSSHGTYDFFENEVMNKEDIKAEKNADTNAIVSSVTKNKEGIGYFGYNFYVQNKDKLKEVKIKDENGKATEPTKKTIQDNSYALSRPLFIYVNEKALKDNKVMSEFIKFVLEDKGKAAEEAGYVAAPEKTYKSQLDDLKAFIDKNQKSDDKKSDDKKSEDKK
ncbi:Phosphate ABC transporter, periplasmic phosphate-binding protein PstS [Staphylococcus aureus]|nr:Phosphate ABC transporter, periplasmic phosphate-binding protein PstS [Staphylococcus aureus]